MKKQLFIFCMGVFLTSRLFSQVGINNTSPGVTLEVTAHKADGSSSEGIIAPRLSGDALHQAELNNKYGILQDGAIAYVTVPPSVANTVGQTINIDAKGYYYYDSTPNQWIKIGNSSTNVDQGTIISLICENATFTENLTIGANASGVSASVPYTGGNAGIYSSQIINSTGVKGLTATLSSGTLASGSGNLVYSIDGVPSSSGDASFAITMGDQSCTLKMPVQASAPKGSGSISGKTCFDVVMVNDGADCGLLDTRMSQKADFSLEKTNTQSYIFQPTSAVSNIRFYYANTNGDVIKSISGGSYGNNISTPVQAIVVYNNNLNSLASGTTRTTALTANIIVMYNNSSDNSGTDVQLTLTVNVQDCACCGAFVASGVYKNFMCQNLGSDMTADPFTPSAAIHGAKYQWGHNPSDPNTTDSGYLTQGIDQMFSGAISGWISGSTIPADALSDNVKTVNDPCPPGYRVPTASQWEGVRLYNGTPSFIGDSWNGSFTNYSTGLKFGDTLFLPAAGSRTYIDGSDNQRRGAMGFYWSSSIQGSLAKHFDFNNSISIVQAGNRGMGYPIRCISE